MSYEDLDLNDPYNVLPHLDRNLGRVCVVEDKESIRRFIRDFRATNVGTKIKEAGLDTGVNLDTILEATQAEVGCPDVYLSEFEKVARRLWLIGDLKPKEVEAVPVDETPLDKNGKPLTEVQLRWSEYTQFSNSHSSAQCKERARTDSGYGSFFRKNLERELAETPRLELTPLNTKAPTAKKVPADVAAYAARYRTMSIDAVRKELSPGMNPQGPAAAAEANRLFNDACAAGLI